ncbi:MAG TPA: hypothetical protein PLL80_02850 [Candidatus Pacearchaeota archaeon]|nr:hypothetical protein [Candidatus Pacearchaeota archaeon]HOK94434.1 hypothetical protein [Candidatus Pacearchaeota archaeon]HPO75512.1 hypothetical protein [Candidatus Pacearchaeota archaeon]
MLTPRGRKLKQINVALGFLTFLLAIAGLIWFLIAPSPAPEEIKSIEIKDLSAELKNDEKPWEAPFTYIVTATLQNPNQNFFVKEFDWNIEIKDENGEVITQKNGIDGIKENEEKKIQQEITIDKQGKVVSFEINNLQWEKSNNIENQ